MLSHPIEPDAIHAWCTRRLHAAPSSVLFKTGHLSVVIGLRLVDGREVVLKARPPAARIAACVEVQRRAWAAGFPCPQPLAGPAPLGALTATVEAYVPGGALLRRDADAPRRFAEPLAELVRLAPPAAALPTLEPAPPWAWWGDEQPALWPPPDDRDADLNASAEPAWLDDLARRVRLRLARYRAPAVIGHADWESQNVRWLGARLHVVHDWDSVAALPEAVIAGLASAVYPADGAPAAAATLDESRAFLHAYERARGRPWSVDDRQAAWAAGLWVRAFNAKKASLDRDETRVIDDLAAEAADRLHRAGA